MSLWDRLQEWASEARDRTLGKVLEALAERKARRDAAEFSIALIALSAKMAKADGVVTDEEISAFKDFFEYPAEEASKVRMIFNLAKEDVAGYEHYAEQVRKLFDDEPQVREDVLDSLFHIAMADGVAHPRELAMLEDTARIFRISEAALHRIRAAHMGLAADDPYAVLGVDPDVDDAGLKAAYRALARDHHPDTLAARGVPEGCLKIAEGRMAAINAAYDAVLRRRRGLVDA